MPKDQVSWGGLGGGGERHWCFHENSSEFVLKPSLQFPPGIRFRMQFFVKCYDVLREQPNLCLVRPRVWRLDYLKNGWLNLRATSRKSTYYGLIRSLNIPPNQSNIVLEGKLWVWAQSLLFIANCCTFFFFLAAQSALLHKHHTGIILLCWTPHSSTLCNSVKGRKETVCLA